MIAMTILVSGLTTLTLLVLAFVVFRHMGLTLVGPVGPKGDKGFSGAPITPPLAFAHTPEDFNREVRNIVDPLLEGRRVHK